MHLNIPPSPISANEIAQLFKESGALYQNTATRAAYIEKAPGYLLFVNTQSFYLPIELQGFVKKFTEEYKLNYYSYESLLKIPEVCKIFFNLINLGLLTY